MFKLDPAKEVFPGFLGIEMLVFLTRSDAKLALPSQSLGPMAILSVLVGVCNAA